MREFMNKKGAAHFEMIVSFVFFVGFVFFLFVFLSPQDVSMLPFSVVSGLYDSFEDKVYTNLSSFFLQAEYEGGEDCFYIWLPDVFAYGMPKGGSYVNRLDGTRVGSGVDSNGKLSIKSGESSFRVMISPEFEDRGLGGCDPLVDYELGGIVEREVVSYDALGDIVVEYYNDYDSLREELGVPSSFDFAIVAESLPGIVMEPSGNFPSSVEVVSRDYVLEVLKKNGEISNERFNLRVW